MLKRLAVEKVCLVSHIMELYGTLWPHNIRCHNPVTQDKPQTKFEPFHIGTIYILPNYTRQLYHREESVYTHGQEALQSSPQAS